MVQSRNREFKKLGVKLQEGDIGVCGIAVLANFSCSITVILILNCGIAVFSKTCGMCFLYVLVDDFRYKNVSFTFFRPFIAVSGCLRSTLKQPYIVTHFNLQFDCLNNPFKVVPLFPRSHRSFLPLFLLSRQGIHQLCRLTIKLRYFPIFFFLRYCGICRFFCGDAVFSNPQCPPLAVFNLVM